MKWLRTLGIVLAGILVLIGLSFIGRAGRRQAKAETREQQYLADGSATSMKLAVKEQAKAKKFKAQAKDAAAAGKNILNRVGEKDESMANMLTRYRKPKRVPVKPG